MMTAFIVSAFGECGAEIHFTEFHGKIELFYSGTFGQNNDSSPADKNHGPLPLSDKNH